MPEPEQEVVIQQELPTPEPEVQAPEPEPQPEPAPVKGLTPEEQSFKDKFYAEQGRNTELLRRLDALEAREVQPQDDGTPEVLRTTAGKKAFESLKDYEAELSAAVANDEMSEDAAKREYRKEFSRELRHQKELDEVRRTLGTVTSQGNQQLLVKELRAEGVQQGTPLEKKVVELLKEDWQIDTTNPAALAAIDPVQLKKVISYARARAAEVVKAPAAKPKPPEKPTLPGGGESPVPPKGGATLSWDEFNRKLAAGEIS